MLVLIARFPIHDYDGFIDAHVLIYARHLAFASLLSREFWLPGICWPGGLPL